MPSMLILVGLLSLPPPAHPHPLALPTAVFLGSATLDWVSTYKVLQRQGHEDNPALRWLDEKPTPMIAMGAAIDLAGLWAWNRYVGRRHPKLAAAGLYVASAFRLWLAYHNSTVCRNRPCVHE